MCVKRTSITISILVLFAISAYQSGFEHGVSDGKDSCLHPDGSGISYNQVRALQIIQTNSLEDISPDGA